MFCFENSHFSFCWLEELSLLWLVCWYKSAYELPPFFRYSFKPHFCSLAAKCGEILEFSDVCKKHLGKPGEVIAILFSLAAIAGTAIVYWVLMSNFLYYSGTYIHGEIYFLFSSYNVQLFVFMLSALLVKTFKPGFHIVVSVVSVVRKKFIGQIEFILSRTTSCICCFCCIEHLYGRFP